MQASLVSKQLLQRSRWVRPSLLVRRRRYFRSQSDHLLLLNSCRSRTLSLSSSTSSRYSTTSAVSSSHSSAAAAWEDDEEDDEDVERFTADCMSQFLPNAVPVHSRLDLELGEVGNWISKNPWDEQVVVDDDEEEEEEEDEILIKEEELNPEPPPPPPETTKPREQKSIVQLLASFDPQNPPQLDHFESRQEALEELQLWLECEAQQEAVLRYQKVLDGARDRKDYSSLGIVQKQILRWFKPLQAAIAKRQAEYITGTDSAVVPSGKRFGPYICTLPPAKLAVITAHEAVIQCALHKNRCGHVSFLSMAKKLGQAVQEEVIVHRVLHQRFKQAQKEMRERMKKSGDFEKNLSEIIKPSKEEDEEEEGGGGDGGGGDPDKVDANIDDLSSKVLDRLTAAAKDQLMANNQIEPDTKSAKSDTSDKDVTHKWTYAASHLKTFIDEINKHQPVAKKRKNAANAVRRARQVLSKDEEWTLGERVQLGAALFQALQETATIMEDGKEELAFTMEKNWIQKDKLQTFVSMNERLTKMIVSDKLESLSATTTRHKPMIVPPKPWTTANHGGYRMLRVDLMRYHGCHTQREALHATDSSTVFDGLNAMGRVKWRINKEMLKVAERCWEQDIPLGDIPSRTDFEVPPEPERPLPPETKPEKGTKEYDKSVLEYHKYMERLIKHYRIKQKNMDLRSLRCSAILKLDQADKFKDFDEIYFPYNMDFRGRAYPIPPHLSNVGSDLCRGLLVFAEAKPLGERGLYWLKVHLANFAGKDKMTFDDRAKFVDEHMDQIRQSAEDPFAGERWWMELEDPFQGLSTCKEIVKAIDSGDPASYKCSLPVHMDGSCNGLQHYAALGRDKVGGKAVNLCPTDKPQDVYIGVMHEVIRRVDEEAKRELDFDCSDPEALSRSQKKKLAHNRAAKLVNGIIDRGVVKRTVMTSVYGVTYIGARQQIQEKVESKLEGKGYDIDEINREVFHACGYLALVTMEVIGDLFTGAKGTMHWLTTCARMISQHGYPVAWVSPIGLPAIQPYRQKKSATLVTLLQTVSLTNDSDDLPLHKGRQVTAFPPNYIHSLDSSHMLLTALEMDRRGLTFSAVHDSFWTHACDIDEMNGALRDVFVDLYSQPLLERLKETWEIRYPGLEFPDLPERGELDLEEVKRAKYFFQ